MPKLKTHKGAAKRFRLLVGQAARLSRGGTGGPPVTPVPLRVVP